VAVNVKMLPGQIKVELRASLQAWAERQTRPTQTALLPLRRLGMTVNSLDRTGYDLVVNETPA
jgi:hypothetical protein